MRILRRDIGRMCLIQNEDGEGNLTDVEVGLIINPSNFQGNETSPFKEVDIFFPNRKPEFQIDSYESNQIVKLGKKLVVTTAKEDISKVTDVALV
jgi:hypothetical protein